jgi:hypothetical protein
MALKHKNKAIYRDENGMRWWITTKGKIFPTNWKLQCVLYSCQAQGKLKKIKEKL